MKCPFHYQICHVVQIACFRVLDSLTGSEDMEFAYQLQTSTGTVVEELIQL
jgi:hypothetical protein